MDYIIDGAILTDIADAIRNQSGETEPIAPEAMAEEIDSLGLVEHETWIITLTDGTIVEKEVALL